MSVDHLPRAPFTIGVDVKHDGRNACALALRVEFGRLLGSVLSWRILSFKNWVNSSSFLTCMVLSSVIFRTSILPSWVQQLPISLSLFNCRVFLNKPARFAVRASFMLKLSIRLVFPALLPFKFFLLLNTKVLSLYEMNLIISRIFPDLFSPTGCVRPISLSDSFRSLLRRIMSFITDRTLESECAFVIGVRFWFRNSADFQAGLSLVLFHLI